MKKTALTEEQIVWALVQWEQGERVSAICHALGISVATIYSLRKRYEGLDLSSLKRVRELEVEKFKLARQIEVLQQDSAILQEIYDEHLLATAQVRSCSQTRLC